ncbi:hypothetical protein FGF1_13770 [Flavobacteriaceae bacterium GF1]
MRILVFVITIFCFTSCKKETKKVDLVAGAALYEVKCAVCHQLDGNGIKGVHPPVSNTPWVNGSKERLINIVLHGLEERIHVKGEIYDNVMPAIPTLTDEEISNVLSYVRNSFGNEAANITMEEVSVVRAGKSLNEPLDLSTVSPVTDYANRKRKERVESRVGSAYKEKKLRLDQIDVPEGFVIEVFAEGLENPRSLALGENGTVFVGSRRNETDFIYAIRDVDSDGKADSVQKISNGLEWNPMGVAMLGKDLYVAEIHRIVRFRNIEDYLDNPPVPELVFNYPPEKKHGDKYIRFGPDGKLYVPVGAPCNVCLEKNPIFSSITRITPEGTDFEIVAHGVRNSRGYDWHPNTGKLWFSDNGRDLMGDDLPPCEINVMQREGDHYGFPFWHGNNIKDPDYGDKRPSTDFVHTTFDLVAHAAPVSLKFYTGEMFPKEYRNSILVSEHGSWNRTKKQGYRIMKLTERDGKVTSYEPFITGWLNESKNDAWGRPVDILQLPDGSLLLSDDYAGVIYRVSYSRKTTKGGD